MNIYGIFAVTQKHYKLYYYSLLLMLVLCSHPCEVYLPNSSVYIT